MMTTRSLLFVKEVCLPQEGKGSGHAFRFIPPHQQSLPSLYTKRWTSTVQRLGYVNKSALEYVKTKYLIAVFGIRIAFLL